MTLARSGKLLTLFLTVRSTILWRYVRGAAAFYSWAASYC